MEPARLEEYVGPYAQRGDYMQDFHSYGQGVYGSGLPRPGSYVDGGRERSLGGEGGWDGDKRGDFKPRGKRRNKNDYEGRLYPCDQCERSYLSNAALLTHKKNKHFPNGEYDLHLGGRRRGRPKKNPQQVEAVGGPTAVLYGFEEAYEVLPKESKKYAGYEAHPLYIQLYKLHSKNVKTIRYDAEHPGCTVFGKCPPNLPPAMTETKEGGLFGGFPKYSLLHSESIPTVGELLRPERLQQLREPEVENINDKKCDAIFAEYLNTVAKVAKKEWYRVLVKFVLLFRECLNHFGPSGTAATTLSINSSDYCLVNNAELAPEISNDFVTMYLDERQTGITKRLAIELTQHLCNWLYNNQYTGSKLSIL